MKIYFITGTNTDIGKTITTAAVATYAMSKGKKVGVMKPVQTGTDEYQTDIQTIKDLCPDIYDIPKNLEIPYLFKYPASPHLAAEKENRCIDKNVILKAFQEIQTNVPIDVLLIEGAGGLLVPITRNYLMIDLICEMNIEVILVASSGLGTINHTLLSIEALKKRNIDIVGVIFNQVTTPCSDIEEDNFGIIESLGGVKVLGKLKNYSLKNPKEFEKNVLSDMLLEDMI